MRLFEITMFIENFYPYIGGAEIQLQHLCNQLTVKGVEVGVLTLRKDSSWPERETIDGFEVVRLSYPDWRYWGSLAIMCKLFWLLMQNARRFRIFHVQGAGPIGALAVVVTRVLGKQAYVSLMGSERHYLPKTTRVPEKVLFWLMRSATKMIAISHEIEKELVQHGFARNKIEFIPYGVDTVLFFPKDGKLNSTGTYTFPKAIFTGRLVKEKGLEYLILAWKEVMECFPSAELLIVGDGPLREPLQQQCRELGIQSNVRFLGMRSNVQAYLQQADLYVSSSISEGLSNSILEAMACGLPVVGTKISGTSDLINHGVNGLLVEPAKVEDLSKTILHVLRNPDLAERLGVAAAQTIREKYSINRIADAMIELYANAIPIDGFRDLSSCKNYHYRKTRD
jgi:glycosyltransferase involved in cell wall biosynthesis